MEKHNLIGDFFYILSFFYFVTLPNTNMHEGVSETPATSKLELFVKLSQRTQSYMLRGSSTHLRRMFSQSFIRCSYLPLLIRLCYVGSYLLFLRALLILIFHSSTLRCVISSRTTYTLFL